MPPDQQSVLKEAFRRYTIAVYVANFDSFSGQRFPLPVHLIMRQVGGTWKVVDVLVDGSISRVAVQRSEMRSPLANGGVPALLERLQRKTAEMSGGQLH
jgi:phospholipid transport system substrate-binding protein